MKEPFPSSKEELVISLALRAYGKMKLE